MIRLGETCSGARVKLINNFLTRVQPASRRGYASETTLLTFPCSPSRKTYIYNVATSFGLGPNL